MLGLFFQKNWLHLLLNGLVLYLLYLLMQGDRDRALVYLIAYVPVTLLFAAFIFACHRGFKWAYVLSVSLILLPALAWSVLTQISTGGEILLYLALTIIGQLLGLGMRTVFRFFREI